MKRQRNTALALLHSKTESYLKLAYSIKWYLAIQWKLNRENSVLIIEIVVHLAKLGAPFQGHGEDYYLKIKDIFIFNLRFTLFFWLKK